MYPHKNVSALGVYGAEVKSHDSLTLVLSFVVIALMTAAFLVSVYAVGSAIVTFPDRVADYDAHYAEVTGQK